MMKKLLSKVALIALMLGAGGGAVRAENAKEQALREKVLRNTKAGAGWYLTQARAKR
jgi:hypothetical protein